MDMTDFQCMVTRLALCQYTWPQCVRWESSQPKTAPEKLAMISRIRRVGSPVCDTSGSKLREQRHWGTHVNILLSSAMTMGSTSCKSSQDVSKWSREQIQPITISTPPPQKKNKKKTNKNKTKQNQKKHRLHFKTWPAFGEGQVISIWLRQSLNSLYPLTCLVNQVFKMWLMHQFVLSVLSQWGKDSWGTHRGKCACGKPGVRWA